MGVMKRIAGLRADHEKIGGDVTKWLHATGAFPPRYRSNQKQPSPPAAQRSIFDDAVDPPFAPGLAAKS